MLLVGNVVHSVCVCLSVCTCVFLSLRGPTLDWTALLWGHFYLSGDFGRSTYSLPLNFRVKAQVSKAWIEVTLKEPYATLSLSAKKKKFAHFNWRCHDIHNRKWHHTPSVVCCSTTLCLLVGPPAQSRSCTCISPSSLPSDPLAPILFLTPCQ